MSFPCFCGHVIKDSVYPCPNVGDLKWQTESEEASQKAFQALEEFFTAVEKGQKKEWLENFFNPEKIIVLATEVAPDREDVEHLTDDFLRKMDMASIVEGIRSRSDEKGHVTYQCPECERIYVQKEYHRNEYVCFEKRLD